MSKTLVEQIHEKIEAKLAERTAKQAELDERMASIESEQRDANSDEATEIRTKIEEIKAFDDEISTLEARSNELKEMEERREKAAAVAKEYGQRAVVTNEPKTYRSDNAHQADFLKDAIDFQFNPTAFEARERITRHINESQKEFRDVGTSAFDGLTVPQFLTDLVAPYARAGRPTADIVRHESLPNEGMVISLSKVTTSTATAVQASENAAVQETNIDDTKLDVNVRTIAGQQDVSRQALDRSRGVGNLVLQDLLADYHTKLDYSILNDDGTSGTHKGIRNASGVISVSYTDASPTVAEFLPKVADAIQQVASNRFLPPTGIIMHPRRWGWLCAAVDGQSRPLVVPNPSQVVNSVGQGTIGYGQGSVGTLLGLPVYVDANILTNTGVGTNQDEVYITRLDQLLLWEQAGQPLGLRFEDVGSATLTVKTVVFGYSAFTAERYPKSTAIISGTGLVTPTF